MDLHPLGAVIDSQISSKQNVQVIGVKLGGKSPLRALIFCKEAMDWTSSTMNRIMESQSILTV